ncbi:serine protease Do [Dysgonomonadaceae bacterium PH5-43]|nr:serine protease Do [Dysgonomonadaceae bacterium PH5-43]
MTFNWKNLMGFLLVSVFSAAIAVGTYSYLDANKQASNDTEVKQTGFQTVGYNIIPAENTDFTLAAENSVNAVVHIKSIIKAKTIDRGQQRYFDPFEFFFGQTPQYQSQPREGYGSGVIISTDGYIVTNNHVIEGADEIEVTTNDNQQYTAKLIGTDASSDIALLKIDGNNFPIIPFGDSDALRIGEWVLAVGNPFNLTSTVTAGIVSAKGRGSILSDSRTTQDKIESFIQTDAAVNPGNSGGALVNTKGELVGINTAIYSQTGSFVGYSFAVPISLVRKVVGDIQQYGMVQRAMLGVTVMELPVLKEMEPDTYKKLKVKEGVYVNGFANNSSAEKAGIKEGDVITAINNTKIKNFTELRAQISRYSPGNSIDVQVDREGNTKTFAVELKNDQGTTEIVKHKSADELLGATFSALTTDEMKKAGVSYGVKVTNVSNGKLKSVGIKDGFIILTVNDNRITSPESLINLVENTMKRDPDERVLFIKGLYPNDRVRFYAIDIND